MGATGSRAARPARARCCSRPKSARDCATARARRRRDRATVLRRRESPIDAAEGCRLSTPPGACVIRRRRCTVSPSVTSTSCTGPLGCSYANNFIAVLRKGLRHFLPTWKWTSYRAGRARRPDGSNPHARSYTTPLRASRVVDGAARRGPAPRRRRVPRGKECEAR